MLFKHNPDREALPMIANASPVYLKLVAMQPGDIIDVFPEDLPRSYRGVRDITNNITRKYGLYYAVKQLINPKGWRIFRVQNLEELKTVSNFKLKLRNMENQQPTRNHNFSDADLAQKVDEIILLATRDSADLTARGVTAAKLTQLQTDNDAFKVMPSDTELAGDVSIAIDERDAARGKVESRIGNVRTMAQNIFGEESGQYISFGFKGMVSLPDNELSRVSKIVYKRAVKFQTELAPEGCDAAFLAAFDTEVTNFDGKIDLVNTLEKDRLEGTSARIKVSNDIYERTEKICNTAKDVYRETDPTKHDEYLMYPVGAGEHTAVREDDVLPAVTKNINIESIEPTPSTMMTIVITGGPLKFFASATELGEPIGPTYEVPVSTVHLTPDEFGDLTGLGPGAHFLNVENGGVVAAHYKLTLNHLP